MNAARCRVVLRPRGVLETFDLTLLFIQANRKPLLSLLAYAVLPLWLPLATLSWWTEGHLGLLLLLLPCLDLVQIPFTLLGSRLLFEEQVDPKDALRASFSRRAALLLLLRWSAPFLILASLGMGIILLPGLHFLSETLLLERVPLERALRRATRLGSREPLSAMMGVVGRVGLTLWCGAITEGFAQVLLATGLQLGAPFGAASRGDLTPFLLLGFLLAQPLHALFRLLLYIDARTIAEGWDLQVSLWTVAKERGL